jgi:hypothetical protein
MASDTHGFSVLYWSFQNDLIIEIKPNLMNLIGSKLLTTTIALIVISAGLPAAFANDGSVQTADVPTLPVKSSASTVVDMEACVAGSAPSYTEDGTTTTYANSANILCYSSPNSSVAIWQNFEVTRTDLGCTTSSVTADLGDFNGDSDNMFLKAYTAGDVLVDTDTEFINEDFTGMITMTVSGSDIAYILTGTDAGDNFPNSVFVDNISFDCEEEPVVAGQLLSLDTQALVIGSIASNLIWIAPVLVGASGAGIYFKTRLNKSEN